MTAKETDLYFEDVVIGDERTTRSHVVTMKDILTFADVSCDHHPLHTDEAYARTTRYGQPIAHGLYGLALIEGLKTELKLYENTSIASLSWNDVRFKAPIFPGDAVFVKARFVSKRESSKGGRGIVIEALQLINQRNEVVIEAEHAIMILCRSTTLTKERTHAALS